MKKTTTQVTESMKNIKEQMDSVKSKINSDAKLKQGLKILRENMKILRDRILTIQSKLSLAGETPYISLEQSQRLEKVFKETTQPQKIPGKMEDLKGKLEDLIETRANDPPSTPNEAFNSLSNEDKRRAISIMKEQTKGIFTLVKKTKENAYKLEAAEFIIEKLKESSNNIKFTQDRYVY
mmetsp:Transcript_9892/g.11190  ORF Transcript_9892/g.11190 Transcript_9892/m.11190 type:complete len:180 (-) Transcript_9892:22-561(-)